MTPEIERCIRVLWEETPQTATQIGAQYGITKNVICGLGYRRGWQSFNKGAERHWSYERTTAGRLDALNAKLDRVLAETEPAIRHRLTEAEREE